jgi:hypothetical protein
LGGAGLPPEPREVWARGPVGTSEAEAPHVQMPSATHLYPLTIADDATFSRALKTSGGPDTRAVVHARVVWRRMGVPTGMCTWLPCSPD